MATPTQVWVWLETVDHTPHDSPSPAPQVPLRRTTLIILCEDGSLRIYVANTNTSTEYWLQPQFQPTSPLAVLRGHPSKKGGQIAKKQENLKFPIDFFEHCQLSQDVEVNMNRTMGRVSYRIFVWEGEFFFKDGKPKLSHALNA